MNPKLTLVSHLLCPYVQRAVIFLTEKQISLEHIDVDLSNKPDWFLKISPLGKTPVLLVNGQPIFESAVICEYLEETTAARMHPDNPLERARHRGWMELASATLNAIGALYAAPDAQTLQATANDLRTKFAQVETELGSHAHSGPYFAGTSFSVVDACVAPVFRYFDVFDTIEDFGVLKDLPRVSAWRTALAQRASVQRAVRVDNCLKRTTMQLGVCYYPAHWPEEWWAEDASQMREVGIQYVHIAEFVWSWIEPESGRFD